jgi:hypothetical protein
MPRRRAGLGARARFARAALPAQVKPTPEQRSADQSIQTKPNKSKEKSLVFLGFLWPNSNFSKGYSESK